MNMPYCALKPPLYSNFALPWQCEIMKYSSIFPLQVPGCDPPGLATRVLVAAPMTFRMTQQLTRTICNIKLIAILARLEKI